MSTWTWLFYKVTTWGGFRRVEFRVVRDGKRLSHTPGLDVPLALPEGVNVEDVVYRHVQSTEWAGSWVRPITDPVARVLLSERW